MVIQLNLAFIIVYKHSTQTLFDKFTSKECKSKPYVASIMSQA